MGLGQESSGPASQDRVPQPVHGSPRLRCPPPAWGISSFPLCPHVQGQRPVARLSASVLLQWKISVPLSLLCIASGLHSLLFHFHLKS